MADRATNRLIDRLADRLADIALGSLSTSLYHARNVQVTTILGDMVDFSRSETLHDYNISNKIQHSNTEKQSISIRLFWY